MEITKMNDNPIKSFTKVRLKIVIIICYFSCTAVLFSQNISTDFISITTNNSYRINKMYLDGNFSPIGWSHDGFFAYAEYARKTTNDYGAIIVNKSAVYIMNTITDEIVEKIYNYTEIVGNNISYTDESSKDISFEEFWQKEEYKVTALLQKYNIVSFPDVELKNINELRNVFRVSVYLVESNWIKDPNINMWANYSYRWNICATKEGKTKIIGIIGSAWSLDEICGYYKSPFEDRIVVYTKAGFDEQNSIGALQPGLNLYQFIGCHLIKGFN